MYMQPILQKCMSIFLLKNVKGVKMLKGGFVMLETRGERGLKLGQKVKVYRNLKNGKFSIVDVKTGLVVAYSDQVYLKDVEFKVGAGGQAKARETGTRNVHAGVVGSYGGSLPTPSGTTEIYYNPFKTDTFQIKRTGTPIHEASNAWFSGGKVFI
jgi:hypothetical protein